jgi:hypothetical protein
MAHPTAGGTLDLHDYFSDRRRIVRYGSLFVLGARLGGHRKRVLSVLRRIDPYHFFLALRVWLGNSPNIFLYARANWPLLKNPC